MSWYGKHPIVSKEEAKKLLPAGACKRCIYWIRCFPKRIRHRLLCSRCSSFDGVFYTMDFFSVPMCQPRRERLKQKYKIKFFQDLP